MTRLPEKDQVSGLQFDETKPSADMPSREEGLDNLRIVFDALQADVKIKEGVKAWHVLRQYIEDK